MCEIWFAGPGGDLYRCRWIDGDLMKAEKCMADGFPLPGNAVVISEDAKMLTALKKKGYCCIGCDPSGDTFFDGAEYVITELESVTEDLISRAYDHHVKRPHVIAETERLVIRESTEEDYPVIADMMKESAGSAFSFLAQESALNREVYLSYIGMTYRFFGFGNWSVCEKTTGEVIGWCGLNLENLPENRSIASDIIVLRRHCGTGGETAEADENDPVELGYVIRRDRRACGYAREACGAILAYARQELGITDFSVRIRAGNEHSLKLARRLGFEG